MDNYTENRFGYFNELTDEELLKKEEEIISEMQYLLNLLEDKNISSEQKSEIENSDLRYERDRLRYVENLIEQRNLSDNQSLK